DLAGDARREVRTQEGGGVADILDGDRAADRGIGLDVAQDLAEAADAGRGQGLDRAGGDRVDADAFRAEVEREVAHAGFQRRLGHAHHVVAGQGAYRAQI